MTAFIEPPRLLELTEAFDLYDANGEGIISIADVPRLLKSLGVVMPDAALANLLHHFTQTTIDRVTASTSADLAKKKVARIPHDDFGSLLATTDASVGPTTVERDDTGVARARLSGNVKVEKLTITLKELLDLLGSNGQSDEQREQAEAADRSRALQSALQLFDVQKNGTVTVGDLRKALRISVGSKDSLSDQDIDRIVDIADPEKTGVVDYEGLVDQLFC